jgi:protein tyrosine phosphatase
MEFPMPKHRFIWTYQFEFLDLEANDDFAEEFKITKHQAQQLAAILTEALENNKDVIVHCVAGVCRSGAVVEAGVAMGFKDTNTHRNPNLLVKHSIMRALGMYYDEDETRQCMTFGGQSG